MQRLLTAFWIIFFSIYVDGRSNQPPFFTNDWEWKIKENAAPGTRPQSAVTNDVIVLSAYDREGQDLTFGVKGDSKWSFFSVDSNTGLVKLKRPFDREAISEYLVYFNVSDGENEAVRRANIKIIDENDNHPLFDQLRYEAIIPENLPVGSQVLRISATDPDTGLGGEVSYSIVDEGYVIPFRMTSTKRGGIITLQENIDYETTSTYRLLVTAQDRDRVNPLTSSAVVTINVEDIQDSDPIFLDLPYDTSINENVPLGTEVVHVKAVDGDRGHPNDIVYSLVLGTEYGKFLLYTSTGRVVVTSPIDRDIPGFDGVYRFIIRATEVATGGSNEHGAFNDISFDVTINDLNDERPRFAEHSYSLSLPEDTPVGTSLPLSIPVQDDDQGAYSDVTMSVDWRNKDFVTVSPVTFRSSADVTVVLTKPLDYEMRKRFQFKIFANETNNPRKYTACDVTIKVSNVNDNRPVFQQLHYQVNVSENTPVDSPILRVHAEDADSGKFGRVVYSLENNRDEIEINSRSGEIRLLQSLDYEKSNLKQYVVTAKDSASNPLSAQSLLTLHVIDENDNAPIISTISDVIIPEDTVKNRIALIKAHDADSYPNDIITYELIESPFSDHFSMDTEDGVGILNLQEPLDFESIEDGSFQLSVSATDSGLLVSTKSFSVVVEDVNDNQPRFTQISNLTVVENIGGGVHVGSIDARDLDSGKNGLINYYVTDGHEMFETVFHLNELTGDITTKPGTSPDYETVSNFFITITAQDNGNPPLSVSRPLRISVTDENDNTPVFDKSIYEITILENKNLKYFRVHAKDADSGYNGVVRYSIIAGNTENCFAINEITGEIRNKKQLDYENLKNNIRLVIKAEDRARQKRLSSTVQVIITIIDENDNAPVFRHGTRELLQVMENIAGPAIGTFQANDADSGNNAKLSYSIINGNEGGQFAISPLDGELRVTHGVELDREEKEFYNLTILVQDAGLEPQNATFFTRIQVVDVNDNTPKFINLPSSVSISENVLGITILQLKAKDEDAGNFGDIKYSIDSKDGTFVVDSQSGIINLVKPLDREEQTEHILHVTAEDNPQDLSNSRSTRKPIRVIVEDVNDEVPKFSSSNPYRATIVENSPPGSPLIFTIEPIKATDADEGDNAVLSYSISGEASSYFFINPETGVISTTANLDREVLSDVIDLKVLASDLGRNSAEATVKVTVIDVNDNSPRFKTRRLTNRILESVQPGHVAARMTASDPDKGLNGKIFYRIKRGAYDKFKIHPEKGIISLAPGQSLDRETTSHYKLIVVASDYGSDISLSSTADVIIIVEDVNDSRPKFLSPSQTITVHENSIVGSTIFQLQAADADLNSDLVFIMTSASIYDADGRPVIVGASVDDIVETNNDRILDWFYLNSTTGRLTVNSPEKKARIAIDREICSSIVLGFKVKDTATPRPDYAEISESAEEMKLTIIITDQNDNSPQFQLFNDDVIVKSGQVIVDVAEECAVGTTLFSVLARDIDQDNNGKVTYELANNAGHLVRLQDESSGTIVSAARLNRETLAPTGGPGWINVSLIARDSSPTSSRLSRLPVSIRINDVNDNSPVFLQSTYEMSVEENSPKGTLVGAVLARDLDDARFGEVSYQIFGAMGFFHVDPALGEISVRKTLDRELQNEYTFTVVARDNEGMMIGYNEASAQVRVIVEDVNDNSPVFNQPKDRRITVMENASPGSSVAMVTAFDPDEGINGQVTYSLQSLQDYFFIDPSSGEITVSRQVATSRFYPLAENLTIKATDGGGRDETITFELEIIDINDHFPKFIPPNFNVIKIIEEAPGGLFVTQANATDDDTGLNGMVRYRLNDPDSVNEDAFLIDDVTGRIITSKKLDREYRQSYSLVIQAHDLGSPSLYASKIITIYLIDVNDNRPTFPRNDVMGATQSLRISESANVGATVGHLKRAIDRDANPKIFYKILSEDGAMESHTFRIKGSRLILNKKLDREKKTSYSLIIGATNNENFTRPFTKGRWDASVQQKPAGLYQNRHMRSMSKIWDPSSDSTLMRLRVRVDDVIDEAPRFSRQRYVAAVEAGTTIGTKIITMNVTDDDVNDVMTYSILKSVLTRSDNTSTDQDDFSIDSRNGDISTATSMKDSNGRYDLSLQVKDSVNLSDTATMTVYVWARSKKLRFVVNKPPDDVKEQREIFTDILSNLTGSIIMIDDISKHATFENQRDASRSDVTIKVFDSKLSLDEIMEKLRSESPHLQQLFSGYSVYDITPSATNDSSDIALLRLIIVVLTLFVFLLIVIFIIYLSHIRRKYMKKIDKLKALQTEDVTFRSANVVWKPSSSSGTKNRGKQEERRESGSENSQRSLIMFKPQPKNIERNFTAKSPTLASTLLWSPSAGRRPAAHSEASRQSIVDRHDVFDYNINLHAPGCEKPLTPLHGSDSGSSF